MPTTTRIRLVCLLSCLVRATLSGTVAAAQGRRLPPELSRYNRLGFGVIAALSLAASVRIVRAPAAFAAEGTWVNYGNSWLGAALNARGDELWVSGTRGVSRYDRRTLRETGRWGYADGFAQLGLFAVSDVDPQTGDVWVGRGNGLSRWDGKQWHHYQQGGCNYAMAITPDSIWTGTGDRARGLLRYNRQGELIRSYTTSNSSLPHNNIWFIRADRQDPNFLWIAHFVNPVLDGQEIPNSNTDPRSRFWFEPNRRKIDEKHLGGLSKWDIKAEKCVAFYNPNNSPMPTNRGGTLWEDRLGRIWFSGDSPHTTPLVCFDKKQTWTPVPSTYPIGCAWSIFADDANNVFTSEHYDPIAARWADSGQWEALRITPRLEVAATLAGCRVDILNNWNLWGPGDGDVYCANGWGLAHYSRATKRWRWFEDLKQVGNTRLSYALGIGSVTQTPDGTIWLYGGRQLNSLDAQGNWRVHPVGSRSWGTFTLPVGILAESLWLAESDGVLIVFDTAGGTYKRYQGAAITDMGVHSAAITAIANDPAGRLWLGFDGAIQCHDGRTIQTHTTASTGGRLTGRVNCIKTASDGRLWIGTGDALIVRDGETWTRYGAEAGCPAGGVVWLDVDPDGVVWLLAKTRSVSWLGYTALYRLVSGRFEAEPSVPSPTMVFVDRGGRVWTSTPSVAFHVRDPASGQWETIRPAADGPAGVAYQCGFQARDGALYFGGQSINSGGISMSVTWR